MKIVVPAVYVLCLGVFTYMQCRRLWKGRCQREAVVYAVSMASSAVVGALLIAEVKVPTLVLPYQFVFEPIGKLILSK